MYVLNAIVAFSEKASSVLISSKTVVSAASAFDPYWPRLAVERRWRGTDKGKEFVNTRFRKLLYGEGIEMRVRWNPDVISVIFQRFKTTLKSNHYVWITPNNTFHYVVVLDMFVSATTTRITRVLQWSDPW